MNEWLFVAVLVFFLKGGLMWLIAFVLSFIACFEVVRRYARFVTEKELPASFPRGVPFPMWMHAIFAVIAFAPAWALAEIAVWAGL